MRCAYYGNQLKGLMMLILPVLKQPISVPKKAAMEAFNRGVIAGLRDIGEEYKFVSLVEVKLADIVIFKALSPVMIGIVLQDPIVDVVMHSSPADTDMVLVDGVICGGTRRLRDIDIDIVTGHGKKGYE
ncbi:hypothetical protein DSL72_007731 [Monilinia vaccinii-corymbosi]|uniref:Amidohydrolase-related domain-containing protein n=1 Tax=Monilinia vaccinii-corymbosi TaxID=61207 RepID=A0A8A3PHY6_9HELO|nr:hypothetical protein DSL72_007731 [Monilinia vaccinii-corymbosi]